MVIKLSNVMEIFIFFACYNRHMKKKIFLSLLVSIFLVGCSTNDSASSSGGTSSSQDSSVSSETTSESSSGGSSSGSSSSSSEGPVVVKSVSLDQTSLVFYEGDEAVTLTATVLPENAANKKVIWSSSDTSVATVSNGVVTPKKPGNTNITVKTVDGKKTATCRVSVSFPNYILHGKYNGSSSWTDLPMIYNEKSESEYMLLGVQLYKDDVFKVHMYGDTWYGASDLKDSIASGLVTAASSDDNIKVLTTGTYDIYSSYNEFDGGHIYIGTSGYTPSPGTVHVDDIVLDRSGKFLQYRNEFTLTPTIYPSTAFEKKVTWSSSDESVATVTSAGRVVAKEKTGTTIITAKTYDQEKTDTCLVYVSASSVPDYYLTGTIGGRSISSYAYAALPLGGNEYFIPNINLIKGDKVKVMTKSGAYVHSNSIGYPTYEYTVTENKSVNMYLTISSVSGGYTFGSLTTTNRASRDIFVKYDSDTNDDNKCGWIYVEGYDITPQWIKSNSLTSGSTGSRFNIPKHAEQITFVRADINQTPSNYYDSLTGKTRVKSLDIVDGVYEYDARQSS